MLNLLAWLAFAMLIWFGWTAYAFLRAASREKINLLWVITFWQVASALAAILVWRLALSGELSILGILAALVVAANPIFWVLGLVGQRLGQYGLSLGQI